MSLLHAVHPAAIVAGRPMVQKARSSSLCLNIPAVRSDSPVLSAAVPYSGPRHRLNLFIGLSECDNP